MSCYRHVTTAASATMTYFNTLLFVKDAINTIFMHLKCRSNREHDYPISRPIQRPLY